MKVSNPSITGTHPKKTLTCASASGTLPG
jgi:hypothetical protein